MELYNDNMKMDGRIPDALSGGMGNQMYIANFSSKKNMDKFYRDILKEVKRKAK